MVRVGSMMWRQIRPSGWRLQKRQDASPVPGETDWMDWMAKPSTYLAMTHKLPDSVTVP